MSTPPESQAAAIIPIRLGSKRLPGKALLAESGQPLFLHTWQRASQAERLAAVYVATDSEEVADAAKAAGVSVIPTGQTPKSGTERCAEAARQVPYGVLLNVQGDWPELDPRDLDRMVVHLLAGQRTCTTLAAPLASSEASEDPNVVKVVRGVDGNALYFSRAPIPHCREGQAHLRLRHIGVYGFTRETLLRIPGLPASSLAQTERLEQLRWLENGIAIHVLDAVGQPWGIEARSDYDAFLSRLETKLDECK